MPVPWQRKEEKEEESALHPTSPFVFGKGSATSSQKEDWCEALSFNVVRKGALRAKIDVSTFRVTFMTLRRNLCGVSL